MQSCTGVPPETIPIGRYIAMNAYDIRFTALGDQCLKLKPLKMKNETPV